MASNSGWLSAERSACATVTGRVTPRVGQVVEDRRHRGDSHTRADQHQRVVALVEHQVTGRRPDLQHVTDRDVLVEVRRDLPVRGADRRRGPGAP